MQLIAETTAAAAAAATGPVATEIRGNSARFYRKAVVLISARPKIADEANERWFVAVTFGKLPCPLHYHHPHTDSSPFPSLSVSLSLVASP